MCLMVYIASTHPLPLIPWNEHAPAFHVAELLEIYQSVCSQFTHPLVYYVGSHEGCGCGFDYAEWSVGDDEQADEQAARATVHRLAVSLAQVVATGSVEIFACWAGDHEQAATERLVVTPAYFSGDEFAFNELQLLIVEPEIR